MPSLTATQLATLTALASGIIPADDSDTGAAAVQAGPRLAEKIAAGVNAALYLNGLETADAFSAKTYGLAPAALTPAQIHDLLAATRDALPAFFKQLRMDVSALYLSDPGVWRRIGFPGPSAEQGGYPDFDQPQTTTFTQLAARQRPADAPDH